MSDIRIEREQTTTTVTIASSGTQSTAIPTGAAVKGSFLIPSGLTGDTLAYEVSNDGGATWSGLYRDGGTSVAAVDVSSIKGKIVPIPIEAFSSQLARIVSGAGEGAERTISVFTSG